MKVTALIVGSSLLGPLRRAEEEINRRHAAGLSVCAYNLGAPLAEEEWASVGRDLSESEIVFVIHVTDGENASRLIELLKRQSGKTVVVINCMPELMRRTRMGALSFGAKADPEGEGGEGRARRLLKSVGSWMGEQARARRKGAGTGSTNGSSSACPRCCASCRTRGACAT